MRLCLVEDNAVADLEPLTLTRPAFDLRLGAGTLGGKIARAFGVGAGPGPPGGRRPALPGRHPARARPAHGRQRPRLAGARAGPGGQRPMGPARRFRPLPRRAPPGSAPATASPPARWSAPTTPPAWSPAASMAGSRTSPRRPPSPSSTSAASGSIAPGTSSPRTPTTSVRDFDRRRGQGPEQPPPCERSRWSAPPTASRSTRRPGSTRTPSSTPPTARSPSPPGSSSSRSPGSRAPATSAATPSSSGPTSGAA